MAGLFALFIFGGSVVAYAFGAGVTYGILQRLGWRDENVLWGALGWPVTLAASFPGYAMKAGCYLTAPKTPKLLPGMHTVMDELDDEFEIVDEAEAAIDQIEAA